MKEEQVVLTGIDMLFGEMVKLAFLWLLAIAIASIPFDLAALAIYALAT